MYIRAIIKGNRDSKKLYNLLNAQRSMWIYHICVQRLSKANRKSDESKSNWNIRWGE